MPSIIMNPKLAMQMSNLEVLARKGCPIAQATIEEQAMRSAGLFKVGKKKHSLTFEETQRELLTKNLPR